jgi:chemotaxis protein MotB
MKSVKWIFVSMLFAGTIVSCVSKKKFADMQSKYNSADQNLIKCSDDLLSSKQDIQKLKSDLDAANMAVSTTSKLREEQLQDLRKQIVDLQKNRDQQVMQVEGMTVLSAAANRNIDKTLSQMSEKDKYINLLHAARTKMDSINLALAVNLKSSIGIDLDDKDVDIN